MKIDECSNLCYNDANFRGVGMKEKEFKVSVLNLEKMVLNEPEEDYSLKIQEIRNKLVELLNSDFIDTPYKLDFSEDLIRRILFDKKNTDDGEYYTLLKEFDSIKTKIDFSNVSFDNVALEGSIDRSIEISGVFGVKINPQTIWNKSLSTTYLFDVEFVGEGDIFKDVKLDFAKILYCKGARINPQTIWKKSLFCSVLNEAEFVGEGDIFEGVYLNSAEIISCKGAIINPQTIYNKGLFQTMLHGVEFVDENYFSNSINMWSDIDRFADVALSGAKILSCKGARINPQTIHNKSLFCSALEGVEFVGEGDLFKDIILTKTRIFECKGARINPQTIWNRSLDDSYLENVEFIGDGDIFKDVGLKGVRIFNCKDAVIIPQTIRDKCLNSAYLIGAKLKGSFKGVDIEDSKFVDCNRRPSIFISFEMLKNFFNNKKDKQKSLVNSRNNRYF